MKFGDKESGFAKPLKRLMQRVAEALTAVFMLLNAVMCSAPSDSEKGVSDSTQKLRQEMFKPLHEGKMDVVFHELRPYYDSVRGIDDNAQLLAALYLAEAYAMREDADSVKYFMDAATPLLQRTDDSFSKIRYYNIKGAWSLKHNLDYPGSLAAYYEGYRTAREAGNVRGMNTMLASITYIYYVLGNPHGMEYALEAKTVADTMSAPDPIPHTHALVAMALMEASNGRHREALSTLNTVDSLISANNLNQLTTLVSTVRGDVLTNLDKPEAATQAYNKALAAAGYGEPSNEVMALYHFGSSSERSGNLTQADSLYRKALAISRQYHNLEFRGDVLLALAKMHYRHGDRNEALDYFGKYHNHIDSLHKTTLVQDFNNLIVNIHKLEKQTEVQKYRIANLRNQRISTICIAIAVLLAAVTLTMMYFHRKRRLLYAAQTRRLLEEVKKSELSRPEETEGTETAKEDAYAAMKSLFDTIEKKMSDEHLYRTNGLTLETLAEAIGSNRTYVSRAVNMFAGVSFSRYVNHFRVEEAVKRLSDPASDILVKELAYSLGFRSDSVFSKVFKSETGMTPNEFRRSAIFIAKQNNG